MLAIMIPLSVNADIYNPLLSEKIHADITIKAKGNVTIDTMTLFNGFNLTLNRIAIENSSMITVSGDDRGLYTFTVLLKNQTGTKEYYIHANFLIPESANLTDTYRANLFIPYENGTQKMEILWGDERLLEYEFSTLPIKGDNAVLLILVTILIIAVFVVYEYRKGKPPNFRDI